MLGHGRGCWFALLVALASAPAWAQSKKYPPTPIDKDVEESSKSKLWDSATNPHRTPYKADIDEARELLKARTDDGAAEAIKRLDHAVQLLPNDSEAYQVRGDAHVQLKDWSKCADDFSLATSRARRGEIDAKTTADLRKKLGLCQARAGKLADAERTLAEAVASGSGTGEVWMRLGEVRIAMGKLEEAIAALEAARDATDGVSPALIQWLLAGAYDRALNPSEATKAAQKALGFDRTGAMLENPPVPFLGTGEQDYLRGLAYAAMDPPRPEYVVVFFRHFVKSAPQSPWRKRAEEHLKELRALALPDQVESKGGNAALERAAATAAVRKAMPQMRACLAKYPGLALKVEITRVGPRTPATPGGRSRIFAPPEGVTITSDLNLDTLPTADKDTAIRCVDPIADKIPMPVIKEKDAYYKAGFYVVAP